MAVNSNTSDTTSAKAPAVPVAPKRVLRRRGDRARQDQALGPPAVVQRRPDAVARAVAQGAPGRRRPPLPGGRPRRSSTRRSTWPSRPTPLQLRASGEPYVTHPIAAAQIVADLGIDPVAVEAALLHDVPEDTEYGLERHRGALRLGGRPPRRRRHEALQVQHPQPRAAAGREHPEDVPGDGRGHPGRPHQARRPAPQHAHARRPADREAAAHRPPDDGDLRAAGRAARDLADQVGARGPRLQGPRAGALPRAGPAPRHPAQGPRVVHRAGDRDAPPGARQGRHRGRAPGPPEAHLQHPQEDAAQERRVRRDLRRLRDPHPRRRAQGLLRRPRASSTPCGGRSPASSTTTSRSPRTTSTRASTRP